MGIGKRIKGRAIAAFLGPTGRGAVGLVAEAKRRLSGAPKQLALYHDITDPWSYLTAQIAERLVQAYGVPLAVHVVSPPAEDVAPRPGLRAAYAVRDARELAAYWDLEFPGKREADPNLVRRVSSALIRPRAADEQLRAILDLGGAMWSNDGRRVDALLGTLGAESQTAIAPALATAYAELRDRGHYQGGMLAYGGDWFWGVDRLAHLEARLAADTGTAPVGVVARRPDAERGPLRLAPADRALVLDLWFSFRSPYSYLALARIEEALAPFGVELRLRPVPPLLDRGVAMPKFKRMYIVVDAKREADRLGIPFGNICDPMGQGVTNCLAISKWAIAHGKGLDFARTAARGIWSEALDVADYVDLRTIVERAGLPWDGAREALADPEVDAWANANAGDLSAVGLWGVPSFRVGDLVLWGQDRIEILVDRLRRHAAAPPAAADSA